jgi:hypothetical protein
VRAAPAAEGRAGRRAGRRLLRRPPIVAPAAAPAAEHWLGVPDGNLAPEACLPAARLDHLIAYCDHVATLSNHA